MSGSLPGVIDVTWAGTAAERVPSHCTPLFRAINVAGGDGFEYLSSFEEPVTWRLVSAATFAKFCIVTLQCVNPEPTANVSGEQVWLSETAPCFLTNATGTCTEL